MKKFFRMAAFALIAVIFIGTFVFLYQRSRPEEPVYEILSPTAQTIARTTVITGTIEPRDEVNIKPQINGIIETLYKAAGESVKAGEIIAKVKVIPEMSSIASAEARLRLAGLNETQAEADFERCRQLYDERLVSTEEFEKARLARNQAREERAAADEALQIVRQGFSASSASYATTLVRSTVDGLILDIPVKAGNSVILSNSFNDGTTIATVADMNDLIFKGTIDETEVGRLHEGMPAQISVGAIRDSRFEAAIEYIAPKVSGGTTANQFEIKAKVSIPQGTTIRAGYSANAEVVLESVDAPVALPESAVETDGGKTFVYVVTADKPQTFERRAVVTGLSDGVHIEIRKGLKTGERVRGHLKENADANAR